MPEHRFAKDQPEWHLVYQRLQSTRLGCARTPVRARKIGMGPGPEIAMPVSAVVPLHSESQRIAGKSFAIQHDLAGKKSVRMRSSGKSNPPLVAQSDAKRRTPMQIPRNVMPLNLHHSATKSFADFIVARAELKRILFSGAEPQALQRKSLNEALWFSIPWKPCGPHLHRHPARVSGATAPARIHQQISEPPSPAAICQS